jgi:TolB-like protein/predicted Zn-dependent protease/tRNA A-37 threonylcarbamoyl transferase component Bud32
MSALEPGATLSHYRVLEKLGQGGQATAWKAEDLRQDRHVVVKILRPELAGNETARRRFEREACLCAALDNPNISAVYDVGEEDGHHFIVMQYVEGQTLKEVIASGPMEVAFALSIAVQIADALAVAHASAIVHRDIKPSNVIVTAEGQAKVLDFGLAKMLAGDPDATAPGDDDSVTEMGVPYGSLGYGSPEQAEGERVDHRSDVFSLGVVLYEMIARQPPFRGKNRIDLLHRVVNERPRPVIQLNARAPLELQAVLDRAMAKDPAERYQTMAAFRDELKALARRLAQNGPATATAAKSPRRTRGPWMLGGTLGRVFGRLRSRPRPAEGDAPPAAAPAPQPARPASWGTETRKTIAVLPFRNLAGDPDASFYEFSLADALITELAQLKSLIVRPSSYIAPYGGQNVDPRQVGEDLAVKWVLVGGFVRAADRLRVTAQVVATDTGALLWSEKIDVPARDLITIHDVLAEHVIAGLRLNLTDEEQERLDRLPTRSPEAYEFYLRGRDLLFRYVLQTLDVGDLERAIAMFNEAVGQDGAFAAAHAALARCYVQHAQGYGGGEYYLLAERSLRRALELDPQDTEARLQTVYLDLHHGDKSRAEETIARLRSEAPNDATVLVVSAMLCRLNGLYDRALEHYDQLLALNPRDAVLVSYNRARVQSHRGDHEQAIFELEAARVAEPDHPLVKAFLAVAHFHRGRVDEAQALVSDVLRANPHFDAVQPLMGWCLSARGDHEGALALLTDRVKDAAAADHDIAFWVASLYGREGRAEDAAHWLERAIRLGNEDFPLFSTTPNLEPVRSHPLVSALLDDLRVRYEGRIQAA